MDKNQECACCSRLAVHFLGDGYGGGYYLCQSHYDEMTGSMFFGLSLF